MILFIDNYDSFTYNLVQYFQELGQELVIKKNDCLTISDIHKISPDAIVIGPGPCTPSDAGITLATISEFAGLIPILGVCLGHQAIGQVFGGQIILAKTVMHGRVSDIYHSNQGVFNDLALPFKATRYHSLVLAQDDLPDELEITAWTSSANTNSSEIEEVMGVRHRYLAIEGVQFHPESILSEAGYQILNNFLITHGLAQISNSELPTLG